MKNSESLLDYYFQYEYFTKDMIEAYIYHLRDERNLYDQIKVINVDKDQKIKAGDGSYFPATRTLNINSFNIARSFHSFCEQYGVPEHHETRLRFYNLYVLNVIEHEVSHANQKKIADEDSWDSLHLLAKEGIKLGERSPFRLTPKEKFIYFAFYHYILTEKNAETMALYHILQINKNLDILDEDEINLIRTNLVKNLLTGYKRGKSAAEYYYQLRGKKKEFQQIDFLEEYTLLDRLSWGMPVEKDQLQEISKEKNVDNLEKMLIRKSR